jgi:hypothetical protein
MNRNCWLPALPVALVLVLPGAARAQVPSPYHPQASFPGQPGGAFPRGGSTGPAGWPHSQPGRPFLGGPTSPPGWPHGQPAHPYLGGYRPSFPVHRPGRDEEERRGPDGRELVRPAAHGFAHGLTNVRPSAPSNAHLAPKLTPTPTFRPEGSSGWKSPGSWRRSGRGWLAGIGAGIAGVFAALFGRRKAGG